MDSIVDDLRRKINEGEKEEEMLQKALKQEKKENKDEFEVVNNALETLGFSSNLKYGAKAKLRKICSRFLRLSYLLDFMSTEALSNIYLLSI